MDALKPMALAQGAVPEDPVGAYFGDTEGPWDRLTRQGTVGWSLRGVRADTRRSIPLTWDDSPFVPGLRVISDASDEAPRRAVEGDRPVVVGTVRMGFGHHRIAYAAYTWALAQGGTPYMHDVLAVRSPEAEAIHRMDASYSRFSRLSSNLGGVAERAWGALMNSGGIGTLRMFWQLAEAITPLMRDIPRDVPIIASHPLNAQIAVHCGFERVINLVIDNHPQHFAVCPGALNLVQSPHYAMGLLHMGMKRQEVAYAGHWVSHGLVAHAEADSAARIARAEAGRPRRLLAPVGGAGAQRNYLRDFVRGLGPRLADGSLRLILNVGDHVHMKEAMEDTLELMGIEPAWVTRHDELVAFCEANALDGPEPEAPEHAAPVTLCAFDSHFEAFSATDLLQRVSDVLVTKPSELAFFPIPKLHIRRVGDHEAASAQRAAELGCGTTERRTVAQGLQTVGLLCDDDELFVTMNEAVAHHAKQGVYDGARRALELALR